MSRPSSPSAAPHPHCPCRSPVLLALPGNPWPTVPRQMPAGPWVSSACPWGQAPWTPPREQQAALRRARSSPRPRRGGPTTSTGWAAVGPSRPGHTPSYLSPPLPCVLWSPRVGPWVHVSGDSVRVLPPRPPPRAPLHFLLHVPSTCLSRVFFLLHDSTDRWSCPLYESSGLPQAYRP